MTVALYDRVIVAGGGGGGGGLRGAMAVILVALTVVVQQQVARKQQGTSGGSFGIGEASIRMWSYGAGRRLVRRGGAKLSYRWRRFLLYKS